MTLSPVTVESEIRRLIDAAESVTTEVAVRSEDAARCDHAYKVAHARALLKADGRSEAIRLANALLVVESEHLERKLADAKLLAAQEAGRMIRAQLDALRSVNANLRSASGLGDPW